MNWVLNFYNMKKTLTIFLSVFMLMSAHAQNLRKESIIHNNVNREYLIYIPAQEEECLPLSRSLSPLFTHIYI